MTRKSTYGRSAYAIVVLTVFCIALTRSAGCYAQGKTAEGKTRAVKNLKEWRAERSRILQGMQQAMGPLPDLKDLPVPAASFRDTLSTPAFDRYTVHLASYPGEVVPVLLYIPRNLSPGTRAPAMIALHGTGDKGKHLTDSLSAGPNRATATELACRGYVVIAPDYPSFGELSGHDFSKDRFESGVMQAIFNHMRCVDYLQSRPEVDGSRIGVIGHSLGGHSAMFLGAFDERIKIVVSSSGWTLFDYYNAGAKVTERYGGKMGPWAQDRYMPLVKTRYGLDPGKMPFDFDEVIAAIAPRYFFSNSPVNDSNFDVNGVKEGIRKAQEIYKLYKVPGHLQVHYPDAGHDFPVEIRQLAYKTIDSVLK